MLRPFPGFATYPTHHCTTGSLKHVYDYHGYPISEDLLLGLGRGLGFVYFHLKAPTLGSELTAIGDRWEEVAAAFAAAGTTGNPADVLGAATKPMHDIADLEQDFWERLRVLIGA